MIIGFKITQNALKVFGMNELLRAFLFMLFDT
jgi:hypothetical protein